MVDCRCELECAHVYTFLERKSDESNPAFFFDKFSILCYYIDVEAVSFVLNLFRKTRRRESSGFFI